MTSVERDLGEGGVRDFEAFAAAEGRHLRHALLARWGADLGADLHAEVMARACADWPRIGALTDAQRVAVLLVHGHGATYQEVADLLGIPVTGITNHLTRGLARLRRELKEP